MRRTVTTTALLVSLTLGAGQASAAIDVVATTEDLAALSREVGGDKVKVTALARGYQDPHYVEPKPSFIMKLHRADLLVAVGRELEVAWLPALTQQSRNGKIQPGADRYLDASLTARILDIPRGPITRAMGDAHPLGNPHYWLDPANGREVARAIQQKLAEIRPGDADYFAQRFADFDLRLTEAERRWDTQMAPYRGLKIVTYHRSWPNFCERFGLDVIGYVEPRPGIPPSPGHLLDLIREMKHQEVKILVVEPYFDQKTPKSVARQTGAKLVVLLPSVGGEKQVQGFIQLFDHNLERLTSAILETGAR